MEKKRNKLFIAIIVIIVIAIIGCFIYDYIYVNEKIDGMWDKPIIYLYPTETQKVTVTLVNDNLLTHSYPKYVDKWEVIADSSGNLYDLKNKQNLYALYYESKSLNNFEVSEEGFVVEGYNVASFLEEKLAILGLNDREIEEFIIYWLPRLENNKYNYIRFATMEEIDSNMPLVINPSPDNVIRVLMIYKNLDAPIIVDEQKLITPDRFGFTVVEWGGTEIN